MDDIICTVPEACGDPDCSVGWHLAHYWAYDDGTYTVCDSDGSHDDCDEGDLPTAEAETRAWGDYYRFVARNGTDPLHEFMVPNPTRRDRKWQARLRDWVGARTGGVMVTGVRRRGRGSWLDPKDAPADVRDYLALTPAGRCSEITELGQLTDTDSQTVTRCGPLEALVTFTVTEAGPPWTDSRRSAWLRRAARAALKRHNA